MSRVPSGFPTGGRLTAAVMDTILRRVIASFRAGPGIELQKLDRMIVINARKQQSIGGGGGGGPRIVAVLPPIPDGFVEEVYWGSATTIDGGNGDDQVWSAGPSPRTKYRPQETWTNKSGTPV